MIQIIVPRLANIPHMAPCVTRKKKELRTLLCTVICKDTHCRIARFVIHKESINCIYSRIRTGKTYSQREYTENRAYRYAAHTQHHLDRNKIRDNYSIEMKRSCNENSRRRTKRRPISFKRFNGIPITSSNS